MTLICVLVLQLMNTFKMTQGRLERESGIAVLFRTCLNPRCTLVLQVAICMPVFSDLHWRTDFGERIPQSTRVEFEAIHNTT